MTPDQIAEARRLARGGILTIDLLRRLPIWNPLDSPRRVFFKGKSGSYYFKDGSF